MLREEIGGKVIVRTGRRIPGVVPFGGVHSPISVVRMAVGDAYGAKEWREGEGDDEVALRTERIERRVCRAVAEFAFRQAERMDAKVFGGPKYTVSPIYEGMLKEEMDAAAERHPAVTYEPQLIDATFALLISSSGAPMVIPALNRDGDILSDLVLPLFGSIAGSESLLVAFGDDYVPSALVAEAAHGTAPALEGKDIANPMAMILAAAALLSHAEEEKLQTAGRAIREAALEAVAEGLRTADLGGHAGTREYTDEVIRRTKQKLEIWVELVGPGMPGPAGCTNRRSRPPNRVSSGMRVAVPRETAPGERRVALVPETVSRLRELGLRDTGRAGRRCSRRLPRRELCGGRSRDRGLRRAPRRRGWSRPRGKAFAAGSRIAGAGHRPDRIPAAADRHRGNLSLARTRRGCLRDGVDPAHHARAGDGRALVPGHRRGLQGRAARGRQGAEALSDADDGRRDDRPGARARHRRGRCGPAGDRDGPAPGRGRLGLRRAAGRAGAGREPRRVVSGSGRARRGDRRRLRDRAHT